jgi:hypothetical protein
MGSRLTHAGMKMEYGVDPWGARYFLPLPSEKLGNRIRPALRGMPLATARCERCTL